MFCIITTMTRLTFRVVRVMKSRFRALKIKHQGMVGISKSMVQPTEGLVLKSLEYFHLRWFKNTHPSSEVDVTKLMSIRYKHYNL